MQTSRFFLLIIKLASLPFIMITAGCETRPSPDNFMTAGFFSNAVNADIKSIVNQTSFLNVIGCAKKTSECEIKSASDKVDQLEITLENGRIIIAKVYSEETALLEDVQKSKVAAAFGASDWVRSAEISNANPEYSLRKDADPNKYYLSSNINIPNFASTGSNLIDDIFYGQLSQIETSTSGKLLDPQKISSFMASIEKDNNLTNLVKIIKLATPLKNKNADLYIESDTEFQSRIELVIGEQTPYIRISMEKPKNHMDHFISVIQIQKPYLISKRLISHIKN